MIKAVVYDLDGMVFEEPRFYTEDLKLRFGLPLEVTVFAKDPTYLNCKKGKISFDEFFKPYYKKWRRYPKYKFSYQQAIKNWFEFAKINKEIVEIAKKLKEKRIVNLILTNNTRRRVQYLDKKYQLSKIFEIIGSYDLGALKPDPIFYKILKEKYNLKPEEILYFDDKEKNVKFLKKLGFKEFN
jgi:HAD superfamily hydrolase (TIGR01509 family)